MFAVRRVPWWARVLSLIALLGISGAEAAPKAETPLFVKAGVAVPEPLRPYVGWVLHDKEKELCPFLHADDDDGGRRCVWPAELSLNLGDRGGRFVQRWRVYQKSWVPIPGDAKVWPQAVQVNGQAAVVATASAAQEDDDEKSHPQILLQPGDHVVSGTFIWDEMPESLAVSKEVGLLSLTLRGGKLAMPSRDDDGRVWLQKEAADKEEDVLELTVHRQVTDEVPLLLTTRIELRIAGKSREVLLGRVLPADFVPLSLDAPLPARLESDGHLRVQARTGTWVLTLVGRHEGPAKELRRPAPAGTWPENEIWVFAARPNLRVVTVEGVRPLDPQQTTLPEAWKRLPCYPMRLEDTLKLIEERRGDADPAADQLSLHREMWLDFDGGGYTVSDHITGTLRRAWRIEVNPPMQLGRVAVAGADQFITRPGRPSLTGAASDVENRRPGVEVRQSRIDLSADSRIVPKHRGELPAVGWNVDFHQVQPMTLHLPPGWRLFHASGADDVTGTWIGQFTLLDLFLLLITAMAVARLYGVRWGVLALLMLGLVLTETDAPRWTWLALLGAEALCRALPPGKMRGLLQTLRLGCLIVLGFSALSFAAQELRAGLHPALEHGDRFVGDHSDDAIPSWLRNAKNREESGAMMGGKAAGPGRAASNTEVDQDGDDVLDAKEDAPVQRAFKAKPKGMGMKRPTSPGPVRMDKEVTKNMPMNSVQQSAGLINVLSKSVGQTKQAADWQQIINLQQQIDPNNVVQTGPGVPRWSWNHIVLRFSGPVQRDQQLRLWLLPPALNLLLSLLRTALLTLLVLRLFGLGKKPEAFKVPAGAAALLVLLLWPGAALANFPTQEMLDTLQQRLLKPPECYPQCASSARMQLEVQPRLLRARLEVGAAAATAVPLPGGAKQWLPERVLLDGKPAPALLRTDDGKLWIQINEGSHQVLLEGELPSRETVQIALPLKPHRVEARLQGWRLDGLHEDGQADDDLQLSRIASNKADAPSGLQAGTLPPFVRVERHITIGLKWEVQTRVVRVTPTGAAVVLEVPLLPGESVTTPDVRVQGQKALCNMAPNATELTWHSLMQERPELLLLAPTALPWTEVWRFDVSPIWHAEFTGIPVVAAPSEQNERLPEWRPWPGEQIRVTLRRPEGIAGSTLTIDHSRLDLRPGLRASDSTLTLGLRSSSGSQHIIALPEAAVLESLNIAGENQPPRQDGRRVTLPLAPGAREVSLRWRQPQELTTLYFSPTVDLQTPSVNAQVVLHVPADRWTLWTSASGGQVIGPVVLFWSYLPVLILLALVLARLRLAPLRFHQYLLLCLGLSQVPLLAASIFLGWLFLLGWRERKPQLFRYWLFNLRQLLLLSATVAALVVLIAAIHEGLLGHPDMHISGNGSSAKELRFFLDHASGKLPAVWLLSVPLFCYRLAMLLWALWMASALLSWLRWGFAAFGSGGLWQPRPPKPQAPESAAPAPTPTSNEGPQ